MMLRTQVDLVELGILLRDRRKELGWKQADLAQKAQVSQGALSQFEQSGTGMRIDRLLSLLITLGYALEVVVSTQTGE